MRRPEKSPARKKKVEKETLTEKKVFFSYSNETQTKEPEDPVHQLIRKGDEDYE